MTKISLKGSSKTKKQMKGIVAPMLPDFSFFEPGIAAFEIHYYYKVKSGNKWAIVDSYRAEQVLKMVSDHPEKHQLMARVAFGNDKVVLAPKKLDEKDIAALPGQVFSVTHSPSSQRDGVVISLALAILQGVPLKDITAGNEWIDTKLIWAVKAIRENVSRAFAICDRIMEAQLSPSEFIEWLYPDMQSYKAAQKFIDMSRLDYTIYGGADRRAAA